MKTSIDLLMDEAGKFSPMSIEEEHYHFIKYKKEGNRESYNKIFNSNIKFVKLTANKYRNQGVEIEDLVSSGFMGMIRAIEEFDYNKKYDGKHLKFITYAVWWIRQYILTEIAEHSRFFKITTVEGIKKSTLNKIINKLEQEKFRKPSEEEINKEFSKKMFDKKGRIPNNSKSQINQLNYLEPQISLDAKLKDKNLKVSDVISDETQNPQNFAFSKEFKEKLAKFLENSNLNEKEHKIIVSYYGINKGKPQSLDEIGQSLSLTRERIRQIKEKSIKKLKDYNKMQQRINKFYLFEDII